jgi:hypothetical protein
VNPQDQQQISHARNKLFAIVSQAAGDQLKKLLETKHLYQQVTIDAQEIVASCVTALRLRFFSTDINEGHLDNERFVIASEQLYRVEKGSVGQNPALTLIVDNVKLFCLECGEREVFSPLWHAEIGVAEDHRTSGKEAPANLQVFSIAYQCQRCKGRPVGIMVRRDGWRLSLDGRSPMEHIEVPNSIPKVERHLFRDAIVAMHGGKALAALFYLRSFIEQYARRVTNEQARKPGDLIMEAYNQTLPEPHRSSMPSLREWYGRLSEALHAAKADEALFEQAKEEIERHFEIRRVYKIPEPQVNAVNL